ncbi:hypothetical protein T552_00306 [Pneumocystis carinii B80]|uniref:Ribosomal RNA-processing protein 42 n=1 Tax=Pneumocystis carinii (strain B80) TaxID=1408658 RepID=A0A0W4ZQE0_PNEC8|nr:hypothetical protein T552_00306 [Pneumocystis carinii B80]KTW30589.1 hypothetical protein T552_00306 [Pneumocystis carinii B80]
MQLSSSQLSYLHSSLLQVPSIRPDARKSTQFRPLFAQINVLPLTYGSSCIKWDDTHVVVGVKAEIIDALDLQTLHEYKKGGKISVNVEIFPDASQENCEDDSMSAFLTQSLQQFLSGIRSECLLVTPTKAWNIFIDAVVISSNSHALPALALAMYLALQTARLPHIIAHIAPENINSGEAIQNTGSGEFEVDYDLKNSVPIPDIEKVGVVVFVGNVGDNILYDLSDDEMAVVEGLLAVGVLQNGQIAYTRRIYISGTHKRSCLKRSIIKKMLKGAAIMGKELITKTKEEIINQANNNKIGFLYSF